MNANSGGNKKRAIRFYKTFEEQAEAEAIEAANQSPVERLRETVELILRVYGVSREDLAKRKKSNRINFTNRQ